MSFGELLDSVRRSVSLATFIPQKVEFQEIGSAFAAVVTLPATVQSSGVFSSRSNSPNFIWPLPEWRKEFRCRTISGFRRENRNILRLVWGYGSMLKYRYTDWVVELLCGRSCELQWRLEDRPCMIVWWIIRYPMTVDSVTQFLESACSREYPRQQDHVGVIRFWGGCFYPLISRRNWV